MGPDVILIDSDSDDVCVAVNDSVNLVSDSDEDVQKQPLAGRGAAWVKCKGSDLSSEKVLPRLTDVQGHLSGKLLKSPVHRPSPVSGAQLAKEGVLGRIGEQLQGRELPERASDCYLKTATGRKSGENSTPSGFDNPSLNVVEDHVFELDPSNGSECAPLCSVLKNNHNNGSSSHSVIDVDNIQNENTSREETVFEKLLALEPMPSRILDSPQKRAKKMKDLSAEDVGASRPRGGTKRRRVGVNVENANDLHSPMEGDVISKVMVDFGGKSSGLNSDFDAPCGEDDAIFGSTSSLQLGDNPQKKRRVAQHDRNDMRIVISQELGNKVSDVMGKVMVLSGREKNVRAEVETLSQPNKIEWRRIDDDEKVHVDCVAYWFSANDFVDMMVNKVVDDMAQTVVSRSKIRPYIVVYGIGSYWRRAARQATKGTTLVISKEAIDECLTSLWFTHQLETKKFDNPEQASEFMVSTAYAVGCRPYADPLSHSDLRLAYANSKTCAASRSLTIDENGEQRLETGDDLGASYQAMLALVPGISPGRAKAIRKIYPSLRALLSAFDQCATDREAQMLLGDVKERSGRRIGAQAAMRLWTVFAGKDCTTRVA